MNVNNTLITKMKERKKKKQHSATETPPKSGIPLIVVIISKPYKQQLIVTFQGDTNIL
jgi:hypothetical protein